MFNIQKKDGSIEIDFLRDGNAIYFSLPIKKDSDYLNICDRYLTDGFEKEASFFSLAIRAFGNASAGM